MKKTILLALLALLLAAPVSATQTESDAIDAVALEWYQTDDTDREIELELELAALELEATSPECSLYAGWHLAAIAIYNQYVFTESPFLEDAYMNMVQSTPQVQYACTIAL